MLERLLAYIRDENLICPSDKLLLAVSGGADSMVLLHLFQQTEFDFSVAHCNFKLRGAESDGEEVFIRDYCGEHGIELFVKNFETKEYAKIEGISIEMAARQLRYSWFEELRIQLGYNCILTAHHRDDLIETMLINLSRGTGIRGLCGMQAKNGQIIRPLLFVSRDEILEYTSENKLPFKNDSSNDELIYQRNIIRHEIIPLFERINPAFRKNAAKTSGILKDTTVVFQQKIEELKEEIFTYEGDLIYLSLEKLKSLNPLSTLLFELVHPYGFNSDQVREIADSFDSAVGTQFFSPTHRLVRDREFLIISTILTDQKERYYIDEDVSEIDAPVKLKFERLENSAEFRISRNPNVVDLDAEKLAFPLILKKWEQGEYFIPFGMKVIKKISYFFIDKKMSLPKKHATWILYSGKKVVWIISQRIDDRFKVTANTKSILRIYLR